MSRPGAAKSVNNLLSLCPLLLLVVAFAQSANAQASASTGFTPSVTDVLGAHGGTRGCAVCHVPVAAVPELGDNLLWGAVSTPEYGQSLSISELGNTVEVPGSGSSDNAEVNGVLLCLSCHDGNITPQNMLATRSYTQKMGLLPFFRGQSVPSLLDDQQISHLVDHPLGSEAKIETGYGLEFSNGAFSVKPRTPYAYFVASYGWPTLAPVQRSKPYGIDADGRPYLVCTTCHNQHVMSVYASQPGSQIAGDGGSRLYTTSFFVNGPYSPRVDNDADQKASSATQFCRQCHFRESNEANNSPFIPTWFQ